MRWVRRCVRWERGPGWWRRAVRAAPQGVRRRAAGKRPNAILRLVEDSTEELYATLRNLEALLGERIYEAYLARLERRAWWRDAVRWAVAGVAMGVTAGSAVTLAWWGTLIVATGSIGVVIAVIYHTGLSRAEGRGWSWRVNLHLLNRNSNFSTLLPGVGVDDDLECVLRAELGAVPVPALRDNQAIHKLLAPTFVVVLRNEPADVGRVVDGLWPDTETSFGELIDLARAVVEMEPVGVAHS